MIARFRPQPSEPRPQIGAVTHDEIDRMAEQTPIQYGVSISDIPILTSSDGQLWSVSMKGWTLQRNCVLSTQELNSRRVELRSWPSLIIVNDELHLQVRSIQIINSWRMGSRDVGATLDIGKDLLASFHAQAE
jgi:hypothetical protein